MAVPVEAIEKLRDFLSGGCTGVCGGCPGAVACGAQTVYGESGFGGTLIFKGGFKELLSLPKLPSVIDPNFIDFGSARQGSGESTRTSEKTCPECKESASTCRHSETSKR